MQSYWIRHDDHGVALERRAISRLVPNQHQLLIKLHAAALNRGELLPNYRSGTADNAVRMGTEAAGIVVEVGPDVSRFRIGERVMGRCPGAFSEYALMDEREAMSVPDTLSWEQAGAIPLTFMVAYDMLVVQGKLRQDEWLFVTGITSGVGVAAMQLAKQLGAYVIGTSGSQNKLQRLAGEGLDKGVLTRGPDFVDEVRQVTGAGANLVINNVGGTVLDACLRAMAYEGRLAVVGYLDGSLRTELDLALVHAQRLTLFGVSNKFRGPAERQRLVQGFVHDVMPLFAQGRMAPLIDSVFSVEELDAAMAHMQANAHVGKIVVRLSD